MKSLLFVHIAKAGGTSLRRLLKLNEAVPRFDCFHNGFLLQFEKGRCIGRDRVELSTLGRYEIAVIALRHPLARLQSCYHYFLSGGLNGRGKGVFPGDLRNQAFLKSIAPSISECCEHLPLLSERIPHFRPGSVWLDSLAKPLGNLIVCCRQESFASDVNGLGMLLDSPLSSWLERRNRGSGHLSLPAISVKALRLIEDFYRDDYELFGYECCQRRSLSLVQYWNNSDPPSIVAERMDACRRLNPSWGYRRFNQQSAAAFLEEVYGSEISSAFLDIRLPAMQADVFRVAFLVHSGGLWIDAATSLLRPVDSWLDRRHSLQMLRRSHQIHPKIATKIIFAARPGLPFLYAVWTEIVSRLLARSGTKVYRDFGPGVFRDLMRSRPHLALGLHVLSEVSFKGSLNLGSSSNILPPDQHWVKRQMNESLYLSGE